MKRSGWTKHRQTGEGNVRQTPANPTGHPANFLTSSHVILRGHSIMAGLYHILLLLGYRSHGRVVAIPFSRVTARLAGQTRPPPSRGIPARSVPGLSSFIHCGAVLSPESTVWLWLWRCCSQAIPLHQQHYRTAGRLSLCVNSDAISGMFLFQFPLTFTTWSQVGKLSPLRIAEPFLDCSSLSITVRFAHSPL